MSGGSAGLTHDSILLQVRFDPSRVLAVHPRFCAHGLVLLVPELSPGWLRALGLWIRQARVWVVGAGLCAHGLYIFDSVVFAPRLYPLCLWGVEARQLDLLDRSLPSGVHDERTGGGGLKRTDEIFSFYLHVAMHSGGASHSTSDTTNTVHVWTLETLSAGKR